MSKEETGKKWALIAIMLGAFLSLLDTTIVNVALPDIGRVLKTSSQTIEWVISGYALAFGLVLITAGRLGDKFGRKPLYIIGVALFLLMSITAGFATSGTSLIISRVVQGLAAGLFFPQINATIMDLYQGPKLAKVFGILGAVIGVATAIGPLTGGLLINTFGADDGWRWVFFVNVPIVIITLILAFIYIPKDKKQPHQVKFDIPGVFGITLALLLLLYPLVAHGANDFSWLDFIVMLLSLPVFLLLYWWSARQEKLGNQPIISPKLLKNKKFLSGMIFSLVYFAAFTSIFFVLSLTWQTGFGKSAISSGLALSPFAFGSMFAAANSNRFVQKLGRNLFFIGLIFIILGLAGTALVFYLHSDVFSAWWLTLPLLLSGIGSGLIIAPINSFTLSTVLPEQRGGASGLFNTAQRVGTSFGIAIVGTVYFRTLSTIDGTSRSDVFSGSLQMSMLVNIALLLICTALVFALPKKISER